MRCMFRQHRQRAGTRRCTETRRRARARSAESGPRPSPPGSKQASSRRVCVCSVRGRRVCVCSVRGRRVCVCSVRGRRVCVCSVRGRRVCVCSVRGRRVCVCRVRGRRGRGRVKLGSEAAAAAPNRQVHVGALLKQQQQQNQNRLGPGPQHRPRNGPQQPAEMRVPSHCSSEPEPRPQASPQNSAAPQPTPEPLPAAQTPENGRSRRRRVPKTCDCCGPNSRHAPDKTGHTHTHTHTHPGGKRRGRRKKEESVAKATETEMTVDMQEEEPVGVKGEGEGEGESQSKVPPPEKELSDDVSQLQAANQSLALTPVPSHDLSHDSHDPSASEATPPRLVNGTAEGVAEEGVSLLSDGAEEGVSLLSDGAVEGVSLLSDGEMEVESPPLSHCVPPPLDHHYCKRTLDPDTHTHTLIHTHTLTPDSSPEAVVDLIHEYLEDFYMKYGSFIPLCEAELNDYLNRKYNTDLSDSRKLVQSVVSKYKSGLACVSMQHFKVTHNKHTLTLEDLATLDQHNWLNDQVINMYGELIAEAVSHKVHFFNSFFYRQLVAKGYEGVKRWTKKVDVFSKRLLLVPLHLEVHWSLVAVDVSSKSLHFYDSQGIMFKYAVDNILKYLLAEAKEKKQLSFQKGWKMLINKSVPQQKNDSDCGVFVLEYCKCLAMKLPLQFSQEDMPKVRKRIYQELCERKLKD